ncbi:hypothetical protein D6_0030 [Aeromonas phage D6]|uniref:Uncharacterized protein n=1 Tax=Aeromonas phage D6 TaxID=2593322 RepID=A0A7G7XLJ3_9CAUD|nr:hypothetical protein PQC08_gp245 [Aeromonas phage D6]QNH80838.1 hypothetical protein D6_0030 [Aeromonas phage D6]
MHRGYRFNTAFVHAGLDEDLFLFALVKGGADVDRGEVLGIGIDVAVLVDVMENSDLVFVSNEPTMDSPHTVPVFGVYQFAEEVVDPGVIRNVLGMDGVDLGQFTIDLAMNVFQLFQVSCLRELESVDHGGQGVGHITHLEETILFHCCVIFVGYHLDQDVTYLLVHVGYLLESDTEVDTVYIGTGLIATMLYHVGVEPVRSFGDLFNRFLAKFHETFMFFVGEIIEVQFGGVGVIDLVDAVEDIATLSGVIQPNQFELAFHTEVFTFDDHIELLN